MRDNDLRLLVEKTNRELQEKELSLIKKEGLAKLQKLEEAMSKSDKNYEKQKAKYSHYVVVDKDGKDHVESGWEYPEDAHDRKKEIEDDKSHKSPRVYSHKTLKTKGLELKESSVGQKMMGWAPNKIDKARDEYFVAGKDDPEKLAAIDSMPVPWNPSARSQKSNLLKRTVGKDALSSMRDEGDNSIQMLRHKLGLAKSKEEAMRIMSQIEELEGSSNLTHNEPEMEKDPGMIMQRSMGDKFQP